MSPERDRALAASPADVTGTADPGGKRPGGARSDRGSVTLYVVIFTIAAFMLASLLVDGGSAISARERAFDIAEQAARAAANDVSVTSLRSGGQPQIDWQTACARAHAIVAAYQTSSNMHAAMPQNGCGPAPAAPGGAQGAPGGAQVASVTVVVTTTPVIPGFFGSFTQSTTATAEPECGITQGQPC